MGTRWQLRRVQDGLTKELEGTTIPLSRLGEKYGVSRQAIFQFMQRRGIKRPRREHKKDCSICKGLLRIAKKPHSDFISSETIREELRIKVRYLYYHLRILREKGLIPQKFGRLHSKKAELAYQIYFKKRLPIKVIGKQVGLTNFHSVIGRHRVLGWDVPPPLFKYDKDARRKSSLKLITRKGKG